MNTLTGIEADRVDQILKHDIDRLHILSSIPFNPDDNDSDLKHSLPRAVRTTVDKLWSSESELQSIFDMGQVEGGKEMHAVKAAHKYSRAICRHLMADRSALQTIINRPESQAPENFMKFIRYLTELRSQIHTRLTTTVEDEAANRTTMHELTERERKLEESRDALQAKLNEVREERERVSYTLDQTLRKLQLELQDLKQQNSTELESVQKEMSDAVSKTTADHELKMRQLQDQIDSVERQLNESMDRNKDEELRLRKEKTRAEITLAEKIKQYDEDMNARHQQLDELNETYNKELEEYRVLKEYFDKADADLARAADEEAILAAVERRAAFGRQVLYDAAKYIQKIARGRIGRAIVNKLKGGGKKGKGKKK